MAIIGFASLLSACKSSDNDPVDKSDYTACNQWISSTMRNKYLWNSEIPADSKLDFNTSPESFFYTLLSKKDGKDTSSGHYYYSYIETNKDYKGSSRAINDDTDSYGIDFTRYSVKGHSTIEYDRVMYVLPDSPAAKAGLKRGDWITKIDGNDITISTADYKKLLSGTQRTLTVYPNLNDKSSVSITLPASTAVNNDPIFFSTVYTINSKKVGYLVYNIFASGPHDDYSNHTYDNELINLFNTTFKGVDEFVLDLRYNPGGYLSCAKLLSRLLVPSAAVSNVFCKLTDNGGKSSEYKFSDVDGNYKLNGFTSLNLSRLYVIATEATASASEAVINGLAPHLNVIKIGYKTEGKNVGSENYDGNDKYAWDIQPITFSITSSANNDYSAGLTPDYVMNELDSSKNPSFAPLGDNSEYLLNQALSLIAGVTTTSVTTMVTRVTSPVEALPFATTLSLHKIRGLIKTPDIY